MGDTLRDLAHTTSLRYPEYDASTSDDMMGPLQELTELGQLEDKVPLDVPHTEALRLAGLPDDGSSRSEEYLENRRWRRSYHQVTTTRSLPKSQSW